MKLLANAPVIIQAMRKKGWNKRATCVNCGIHSTSLKSILNGIVPQRLPVWYRLLNGLGLEEQEALIATTHNLEKRKGALYSLPGGRQKDSPFPRHR